MPMLKKREPQEPMTRPSLWRPVGASARPKALTVVIIQCTGFKGVAGCEWEWPFFWDVEFPRFCRCCGGLLRRKS